MISSSKRNLGKHPKEVKLMGLKGIIQKVQINWIMWSHVFRAAIFHAIGR